MLYNEIRAEVVATARRMHADGLVRLTSGNVSCRAPGGERFIVTPSGMPYASLQPADAVVVDLQGRIVEGSRRPSVETPLHRLILQTRPDVGAVVHTHSLYATACACLGEDLPVITAELAMLVGGAVRLAPYRRSGTEEFAEVAVAALGDRAAALFQNHGAVAVGATLAEAYAVAVALEEAAHIYCIARSLAQPTLLSEAEGRELARQFRQGYGQPADSGSGG